MMGLVSAEAIADADDADDPKAALVVVVNVEAEMATMLLVGVATTAIADKLAGVSKNKKAAQAYAGPRKSGPRYQDREA